MLYIFDKDGTLIAPLPGRPANSPEEQIVMDGVLEKLEELRQEGHTLAIASNQGGVAFGYMSAAEAVAVMRDAATKTGIMYWSVCPHHPDGTIERLSKDCYRRKPNPGMLKGLMENTGFPKALTVFVGDQESDRQAAEAAGVEFRWADEFFGRE
jgi:D-glycero-D-manno-heptose 1,7-bisphosphate phosphatase